MSDDDTSEEKAATIAGELTGECATGGTDGGGGERGAIELNTGGGVGEFKGADGGDGTTILGGPPVGGGGDAGGTAARALPGGGVGGGFGGGGNGSPEDKTLPITIFT